jgi:hypothetical protein
MSVKRLTYKHISDATKQAKSIASFFDIVILI